MSYDTDDMTPAQVRQHLRERMETEGAVLAFETAVGICRGLKAPATAKAQALKVLLAVAGYDGKREPDRDKPVSEMTRGEVEAMIVRLKREETHYSTAGASDLFD